MRKRHSRGSPANATGGGMTSGGSTICSGGAWGGGPMPRHMVAEDLANGTLVELQRRAWHMRPLTFMISQRRGYSFSECETRLVELLGNPHRFPKDTSQRPVSRKGKKP